MPHAVDRSGPWVAALCALIHNPPQIPSRSIRALWRRRNPDGSTRYLKCADLVGSANGKSVTICQTRKMRKQKLG
jgi:hypothetical protein